jgi:hypothetical protein
MTQMDADLATASALISVNLRLSCPFPIHGSHRVVEIRVQRPFVLKRMYIIRSVRAKFARRQEKTYQEFVKKVGAGRHRRRQRRSREGLGDVSRKGAKARR